ncbi:hypothetical protein C4D60_Mb01t22230 [Musa balbisiana]|uniref:Uncharacterized protein n=1 Tax=Musa balbisiana TaxID=52838 RepID=A0A4S8JP51_MUSBA|nr:hypothetical protein C4D60_Mb01t22230 [Musa balbisiana]
MRYLIPFPSPNRILSSSLRHALGYLSLSLGSSGAIEGKEKSPELDDGETGFPPRADDGGGSGGGGHWSDHPSVNKSQISNQSINSKTRSSKIVGEGHQNKKRGYNITPIQEKRKQANGLDMPKYGTPDVTYMAALEKKELANVVGHDGKEEEWQGTNRQCNSSQTTNKRSMNSEFLR